MAPHVTNLIGILEDTGSIPDLAQWAKDPAWQWLCWRSAPAAPVQRLAWELPHAAGEALKKEKTKKPTTTTMRELVGKNAGSPGPNPGSVSFVPQGELLVLPCSV